MDSPRSEPDLSLIFYGTPLEKTKEWIRKVSQVEGLEIEYFLIINAKKQKRARSQYVYVEAPRRDETPHPIPHIMHTDSPFWETIEQMLRYTRGTYIQILFPTLLSIYGKGYSSLFRMIYHFSQPTWVTYCPLMEGKKRSLFSPIRFLSDVLPPFPLLTASLFNRHAIDLRPCSCRDGFMFNVRPHRDTLQGTLQDTLNTRLDTSARLTLYSHIPSTMP